MKVVYMADLKYGDKVLGMVTLSGMPQRDDKVAAFGKRWVIKDIVFLDGGGIVLEVIGTR